MNRARSCSVFLYACFSSTGTEGASNATVPLACDASILNDNVGPNTGEVREGESADLHTAPAKAVSSSVSEREMFRELAIDVSGYSLVLKWYLLQRLSG